jgi:hypothetical protein
MSMSPIVRYYGGQGTDDRGRTLAEVQAFDAAKMEYIHDFIQWMFPLREASSFHPEAPVLTDADVRAFHDRPELRAALRTSFEAFLGFLGLKYEEEAVREAAWFPRRAKVFEIPNHNWLRITRVLLCLHTLGLPDECRAFFDYLQTVHDERRGVTADTFAYWRDAARGVAR